MHGFFYPPPGFVVLSVYDFDVIPIQQMVFRSGVLSYGRLEFRDVFGD